MKLDNSNSTIQATYVIHNVQARSPNHCCRGKAMSITYCECVFVALVFQQAKRTRRVILPPVTCPSVPYFSTLSQKLHDFPKEKKKVLLSIKCVF
jgi:hypothetical protein